jgi:hypothetical protein
MGVRKMDWFLYPICVKFADPNVDTQYNGAHDMDVQTPPNTPITALLAGVISSITSPIWGMQIGVKLDTPSNNIAYMSYLHLSAVNPSLKVGSHINTDDLIAWSGGCTQASQYQGTSNPTGQNFLDDLSQSSQPQTGIALMYGPEYGVGAGWTTNPDPALNPMTLIYRAKAAYDTWHGVDATIRWHTGISAAWFTRYLQGTLMPPPFSQEFSSVNWQGQSIIAQEFATFRIEWDSSAHFYFY